jgi:hypothetical protein
MNSYEIGGKKIPSAGGEWDELNKQPAYRQAGLLAYGKMPSSA